MDMCGDCDAKPDGKSQRKVGLLYDEIMCKHDTPDGEDHQECPDRIRIIWKKLQLAGFAQRCVVLRGIEAKDKHLQLAQTKNHVNFVKNLSTKQKDSNLNEASSKAAYLAAGSVVEVAEKVAEGELDCGFAIVKPPGHHAEAGQAMGFCLFNNVAVAASYLLNERPDIGVKKILIVDWDVHHGNGTQNKFWKYPILTSSSNSKSEDYTNGIRDQMSKLNLENNQVETASPSWRADLAKVNIWYASYGSNMWKPRFLCYIQGGKVEGMKKVCVGSKDKTLPKEILWKTFPHRLFFGREANVTWGVGGVAFTNPLTNFNDQTHMCLYRITLEQFNDVLFQENGLNVDSDSPLFDLAALKLLENKGSIPLEAASNGWYGNVVYLGKDRDIPILTMTCMVSDVEKFTSGEIPLRAPAKAYANTLIRGLVEGGRFSEEEAKAYIDNAASTPPQS